MANQKLTVMTVLGTRPEIIRLSRVIPMLDAACNHVLVHTGQNFDAQLSDVFFKELKLRSPDRHIPGINQPFAQQLTGMLAGVDDAIEHYLPDRLLVLGDTNSGLAAAILAKRCGIPVYHLEAGNRCYSDEVPEEVNRRLIDHASDVLMPYTERSRANLLREGIDSQRIYVVGNPINEVMKHYGVQTETWGEWSGRPHILATMHRSENVDRPEQLEELMKALQRVAAEFGHPVIWPVHPHTKSKIKSLPGELAGVELIEPLGFFAFVAAERSAQCVLTDSGTVQEECCLLHVPTVTLRDVTERPETIECGSNILAGRTVEGIVAATALALKGSKSWDPPAEYLRTNVAETVVHIVLGHQRGIVCE